MSNLMSALSWASVMAPASVYDPTTDLLTGFWRGSFSGSPWVGTASAGSSGTRDLTEATNPPSTGAAQNGYVPADFDGTNDVLGNATAMSTLLTASGYYYWALFELDAITGTAADSTAFSNAAVWSDSGGFLGMHMTTEGSNNRIQCYHWDGAAKVAALTGLTTGAYHLVQCRFTGSALRARLNSGSIVNVSTVGNVTNVTGTLRVGRGGALFMNGRLLELGMRAGDPGSDAIFDNTLAYVNNRYALSL